MKTLRAWASWTLLATACLSGEGCGKASSKLEPICARGSVCLDAGGDATVADRPEVPEAGSSDATDGTWDGGIEGERDATGGGPDDDAGEPDATHEDAGELPDGDVEGPLTCRQALAAPPTGFIRAETVAGGLDVHFPRCADASGPDHVYRLEVPVQLRSLEVETLPFGATFDTVLNLLAEDCEPSEALACDDDGSDFALLSRLRLANVAPGTYYVIVGGFGGSAFGDYALRIEGEVALGEACDPESPFARCIEGACGLNGGRHRCLPLRDCEDGFDNDGDGSIDEDARQCTSPPSVTCPPPVEIPANAPTSLVEVEAEIAPSTARAVKWEAGPSVTGTHFLTDDHALRALLLPTTVGQYDLRFTAAGESGEAVTCEAPIRVVPGGALHVELTAPAEASNARLYLASPRAESWGDSLENCVAPDCQGAHAWGGPGPEDDPSGFSHLPPGTHQAVYVETPERLQTYSVGVHLSGASRTISATVRIHCGGRALDFGPVTLRPVAGGAEDPSSPFWRVADVTFDGSDCTVTPFGVPGAPSIITYAQSQTMR